MHTVNFKFVDETLNNADKQILFPEQKSLWASGFDLASAHREDLVLKPFERILVNTGIALALERGFEGQVRSRSGLSLKNGIIVLNAPGTIDADYRGEIKVIMGNFSHEPFVISFGMRIAQLVIVPIAMPVMTEVMSLEISERGEKGFGSTGIST
jgi:dUTP pyrophosphatase